MDSLPIPDELLADIFLRLPTPADLVRASATCTSFRRVITIRSILRQYRRLHAPPLLGLLKERAFYSAVPPHPPRQPPTLSPAPPTSPSPSSRPPATDWVVLDSRDDRVLLDRSRDHDNHFTADWQIIVFREIAVCDPLNRRYLVLPHVPEDLAAAMVEEFLLRSDAFLIPADNGQEKSFEVVWIWQGKTMLVAFVFSSSTGQWQAVRSRIWIDLFPNLISSTKNVDFCCRTYAYGCFYCVTNSRHWKEEMKILLFNTRSMEFSIATGSVGKVLLLVRLGKPLLEPSCFTLDIKTFKFQKMCGEQSGHAYSNFPASLLSSPTVSSGTPEVAEGMLEQVVEALRVGEAIHVDAGGWSGL